MLNPLKKALVESYVGAVALGYLLAQIVLQFVGIFGAPISGWATRTDLKQMMPSAAAATGFSYRDGLPYLVRFVVLVVVWLILVRWLYYKSVEPKQEVSKPTL